MSFDYSRRNGVEANAAWAERGGQMLHQSIDRALSRRISGEVADARTRRQRGEKHDARSLAERRQQLLNEKERRADIHGEQPVEIRHRLILDRRRGGDPSAGDENIEPGADPFANRRGELMRSIEGGEIGAERVGLAASVANGGGDGFGFVPAAAIMNDDARAGGSECERRGAADAARGAGDKGGLVRKVAHGFVLAK
jgi:hypothetical protein